MQIRTLTRADADAYRTLMLEVYATETDAFTSTARERGAMSAEWWQNRVAHEAGTSIVIGAIDHDTLVGVVGVAFETRDKTRHKATVFGMYVRDHARGQGLGRRLVERALAHARARPGIALVQLTLTEGNAAARALYASCGFVPFAVEPMGLRMEDGYRSIVHMWCPLDGGHG